MSTYYTWLRGESATMWAAAADSWICRGEAELEAFNACLRCTGEVSTRLNTDEFPLTASFLSVCWLQRGLRWRDGA